VIPVKCPTFVGLFGKGKIYTEGQRKYRNEAYISTLKKKA